MRVSVRLFPCMCDHVCLENLLKISRAETVAGQSTLTVLPMMLVQVVLSMLTQVVLSMLTHVVLSYVDAGIYVETGSPVYVVMCGLG